MNLETHTNLDMNEGSQAAGNPRPHPRVRLHRAFPSHYLADKRDLIVYVPPCYDRQPERTYPVLYLHDGQNLFDGRTSFVPGHTWQVREHADAAIEAGEIEPLVIVGIYNTGDRRLAEYTFERNWQMGGGEADKYGAVDNARADALDLQPISGAAGSRRNGNGRVVIGWIGDALSGFAASADLRQAGALSPSVWWNHKSILGYLNEQAPQIWERPRLWLDVGDRGATGRCAIPSTLRGG